MLHQKLTEQEINALTQNIDALYIYLDTFMDQMSEDEKHAWITIIKEIDPDFEKIENRDDD